MQVLTKLEIVDQILLRHRAALGQHFQAYKNHCYRVLNYCLMLGADGEKLPVLSIAIAHHDLGLWVDATFDYLKCSSKRAVECPECEQFNLSDANLHSIRLIIENHHKLTEFRSDATNVNLSEANLVEIVRKADWIDLSFGLRRFSVSRLKILKLFTRFPSAGFHLFLGKSSAHYVLRHRSVLLPMFRW